MALKKYVMPAKKKFLPIKFFPQSFKSFFFVEKFYSFFYNVNTVKGRNVGISIWWCNIFLKIISELESKKQWTGMLLRAFY